MADAPAPLVTFKIQFDDEVIRRLGGARLEEEMQRLMDEAGKWFLVEVPGPVVPLVMPWIRRYRDERLLRSVIEGRAPANVVALLTAAARGELERYVEMTSSSACAATRPPRT